MKLQWKFNSVSNEQKKKQLNIEKTNETHRLCWKRLHLQHPEDSSANTCEERRSCWWYPTEFRCKGKTPSSRAKPWLLRQVVSLPLEEAKLLWDAAHHLGVSHPRPDLTLPWVRICSSVSKEKGREGWDSSAECVLVSRMRLQQCIGSDIQLATSDSRRGCPMTDLLADSFMLVGRQLHRSFSNSSEALNTNRQLKLNKSLPIFTWTSYSQFKF